MAWTSIYLGCFVLGVSFTALSALAGQFGGEGHGDHGGGHGHEVGHGGHDGGGHGHAHDGGHDGAHEHAIPLPLLSPTVLAVFVGMFGAGGLLFLRALGMDAPLLHVPGALAVSGSSGFGIAWLMKKVITHGESNSLSSHAALVGREVEITVSIRGAELGEITYDAAGARHTLIARSHGDTFLQGERAQVVAVEDGIARVAPLGSRPALLPVSSTDPHSLGVPAEQDPDAAPPLSHVTKG